MSTARSVLNGRLPEMKTIEPHLADRPARMPAQPGETGGSSEGAMTSRTPQPARAQRGGCFLDFPLDAFNHRLQRADDERHPHECQRDDHAQLRVRAFDTERHEELSEPAVRREQVRQRQPGDGGRQRKGEIHQRINETPTRKFVTRQDPREQRAENRIGARRNERRAEGKSVGRQSALGCGQMPEIPPRNFQRFEDDTSERNEHNHAQIKKREAHRQAEAWQYVKLFLRHAWPGIRAPNVSAAAEVPKCLSSRACSHHAATAVHLLRPQTRKPRAAADQVMLKRVLIRKSAMVSVNPELPHPATRSSLGRV